MATQTIEIRSEHPGEANTTAEARDPDTEELEQTSAVLAAPTASGVRYLPEFTNLPAGEWLIVHKSAEGEVLTWGYATVAMADGTYKVYGVRASELPATAVSVAAVKADTATLVSRVTSTVATLWANLTAMISGSVGTAAFTETALANAPAGGGGGSGDATEAKQDLILSKLAGTPINVVSAISNTGTVTLRLGDDDVGDRWRINYPVANGAALRTFLQSAAVTAAYFVARQKTVNDLVIEIDSGDITAPDDDGTILVPIEIPKSEKPTRLGDYRCSILAVTADGQHHETIGQLTIVEQIGTAPE